MALIVLGGFLVVALLLVQLCFDVQRTRADLSKQHDSVRFFLSQIDSKVDRLVTQTKISA